MWAQLLWEVPISRAMFIYDNWCVAALRTGQQVVPNMVLFTAHKEALLCKLPEPYIFEESERNVESMSRSLSVPSLRNGRGVTQWFHESIVDTTKCRCEIAKNPKPQRTCESKSDIVFIMT